VKIILIRAVINSLARGNKIFLLFAGRSITERLARLWDTNSPMDSTIKVFL